ncbi:MAG: SUMF1/EgtB/PvdO family nonheme iron enzyme [Flavobacterium sp.]|nr:SUMF1/EgtB/PvdO family nonheme iron enzyme [Flavobacterium sp.]
MNSKYIEENALFLQNNLNYFNILIITATLLEKDELHKCLLPISGKDGIVTIAHKRQTYFLAKYGKYNVVHVACGDMGSIGRESSITTTIDAIEACQPKIVLMIGIAFGIDRKKQKVGDLLIAERIIPYEPQRIGTKHQNRGKSGPAGTILINRVRNINDWHFEIKNRQPTILVGDVLSGEKLIDDKDFSKELTNVYPLAKGGEMEGAGIYAACDGRVNEWIMIKGICDFADGKKKYKKKENQLVAVSSAISFCEHLFNKEFAFDDLGIKISDSKKRFKTVMSIKSRSQKQNNSRLSKPVDKQTKESNNIKAIFIAFRNVLEQLLIQNKNISLQLKAVKIRAWLDDLTLDLHRQQIFYNILKKVTDESTLVKNIFNQSIISDSASVQQMIAATIFEMGHIESEVIPTYLIQELKISESNLISFKNFLYDFRKKLSNDNEYSDIISFVDDLLELNIISGFANKLASELDLQKRIEDNFIFESKDRKLNDADTLALGKYLYHLRKHQLKYSVLPLARSSSQDRSDATLKDIYVPVDIRDSNTNRRNSDITGIDKNFESNDSKVGTVISKTKNIVLLGPPGIGKTTLLRHLALSFAEGRSNDIPGWKDNIAFLAEERNNDISGWKKNIGAVPIFFKLRSFHYYLQEVSNFVEACPGSIISYLDYYYREAERVTLTANFFDNLLDKGGCAVFIDGLDEVPMAHRTEVAKHLNEFIKRYKTNETKSDITVSNKSDSVRSNFFVLSSRPKGYESVEMYLKSSSLAVREVKPLEPGSIRQLINNILNYIESDSETRQKDFAGICESIFRSSNLTVLGGTPLFCTSLVMMYKYHGAELPQRRVDVYEEIINLLLGFWKAQDDKARKNKDDDDGTGINYPDLKTEVKAKKKRLAYIALQMQKEKKWPGIDFNSLVSFLKDYFEDKEGVNPEQALIYSELFLHHSHERSGLLVETEPSDPPIYSFTHEGFREYLVADALINLLDTEFVNILLEHIDEPTWEEVIVLSGAHSELGEQRRELILDKCVKAGKDCKLNNNWEGWSRRMIMAGRIARDMRENLSRKYRDKLKETLAVAILDTQNEFKYRLDIAFVLDELGWLSENLYTCTPIVIDDKALYIGKNLISNQQYQRFLDAPDFRDLMYWQDHICLSFSGKSLSLDESAINWINNNTEDDRLPRSWNDNKFGISHPGVPIVGISWYEANAYCKWLLKHWDELEESLFNPNLKPIKIRLPSEEEWNTAVFNDKTVGNLPWINMNGKDFHDFQAFANIGNFLDRTSPLGMFSKGTTFSHGLVDAIGNVWEWQSNYFDYSQRGIAIKGGAFSTLVEDIPTDLRGWSFPTIRENDIGFRIIIEA